MSRASIVSGNIPNMISGVSQQAASQRLPSQFEELINGLSSVVDGLNKRPPTQHVFKLLDEPLQGAFTHFIDRDNSEQYIVVISNGDLKVYNRLTNEEMTVTFPNGKDYLTSTGSAEDVFSVSTVIDTTFICNTERVVQLDDANAAPVNLNAAIVWVKQGDYQMTYNVVVDGNVFSYETGEITGATTSTVYICTQLAQKIVAGGYAVNASGSQMMITRQDGTPFSITVSSTNGDEAMVLLKDRVQAFSDLPAHSFAGFRIEVYGTNGTARDNYWVQYDDTHAAWVEVPAPGRKIRLLPSSMPHTLVRQADGTFKFGEAEWADCGAGDTLSCADPSFVGHKINDLAFYMDRVVILADEAVVLSQSGKYFNFWRQSGRELYDDDRLDIQATSPQLSILRRAAEWDKNLVLFADSSQHIIQFNENGLTPTTAALLPLTRYRASLKAHPMPFGKGIFYPYESTSYTAIRVVDSSKADIPIDHTSHVPRLIPAGVLMLGGSADEDTLMVLTGQRDRLYVYRWFYSDDGDKVQSSWCTWTFGEDASILNMATIASEVYLLIARPSGTFIEKIELREGLGEFQDYAAMVDRRLTETQVSTSYDAASKTSTVTLPFPIVGTIQMVSAGGATPLGYQYNLTKVNDTTVTIKGIDLTGAKFWIGQQYEIFARLSEIFLREQLSGGGQSAVTAGRLQLTQLILSYAHSGYFRVEVQPPGARDKGVKTFTGRTTGVDAVVNALAFQDGTFTVPLGGNSTGLLIDIRNDSPYPCRFLKADWIGRWTSVAMRRVS